MTKDDMIVADAIVALLKHHEVDGETMEYIINQVGMRDQMINQLYLYPLQADAEEKQRTADYTEWVELTRAIQGMEQRLHNGRMIERDEFNI